MLDEALRNNRLYVSFNGVKLPVGAVVYETSVHTGLHKVTIMADESDEESNAPPTGE